MKRFFLLLINISIIFASNDSNKVFYLLPQFTYSTNSIKLTDKNIHSYKFLGDILSLKKNCFVRDLGNYGQPYDLVLYGNSQPYTSVIVDGNEISSPITHLFDFNYLQTSNINSIEIIEPYQSFLYGVNNYQSLVNIKTKYQIPDYPTSEVKYIQSSGEDAFLEFSFASRINNQLSTNLNIKTQNNETDNSIISNSSNSWKINSIFIYNPDDKHQFILEYNYNQMKRELNGGVDVDRLIPLIPYKQFYNFFYDKDLAPVIYTDLTQTNYFNYLKLNHIFDDFESLKISSNIIYSTEKEKYLSTTKKISYKYQKYLFTNDINYHYDDFNIWTKLYLNSYHIEKLLNNFKSSYGLASKIKKDFNNLELGIFGKIHYQNKFYISYGTDAKFNYENFNFLVGASVVDMPAIKEYYFIKDILQKNNQNNASIKNIYTSLSIKFGKLFNNIELSYSDNSNYIYLHQNKYQVKIDSLQIKNDKFNNLSLKYQLQFNISNFIIENNFILNSQKLGNTNLNVVPKFSNRLNLSYNDLAYNDRLNYKIGFEFIYNKATDFVYFDYLNKETVFSGYATYFLKSDPKLIINGYINAKIINRFTIFFVFENLLNYNYTIMPNFPIFGNNYRLGINWLLKN